MSEIVNAEPRPMREDLPCGCYSAVVRRLVPAFDPVTGFPRLDAEKNPVMEEREEVEEGYCATHSVVVHERMLEAQRMLAEGKDSEEVLAIMAGHGHPALSALGDDRNGGDE